MRSGYVIASLAAALAVSASAFAQQPASPSAPLPITQQGQGIKRIPLQKFDVPGTAMETVIGIAEIAPNVTIGRHTHFGPESGYVVEGEATLLIDGQPARELKVGDSYVVPAGVPHDAKTTAKGAKVIATYVVEKGKPLATPAPAK